MGRVRVRSRRAGGPWGILLLVGVLTAGGCAASLSARGDEALAAGDAEGALGLYQKALAKDPGDPQLLGKVAEAQVQVASARTRQGDARLAAGDGVGAYARYHAALAVKAGDPAATAGATKALSRIDAVAKAKIDKADYQPALDLLAAAEKAGVPGTAVAGLRKRARAGLARAACAAGKAFEDKGLPGNALLAFRRARSLAGGGCDAAGAVARLRGALDRAVLLGLKVQVEAEGLGTLMEPALAWVAGTGVPMRVEGLPPAPAASTTGTPTPTATVHITGTVTVKAGHAETPTTLTLVRKIGEKTEANPEYKTLRRQAEQLLGQYQQLEDRAYSQARYVQALHQAYLQSPSPSLLSTLEDALQLLDDLQQQANDMGREYNRVRAKLGRTAELLKKTVTEDAKVKATDVRQHARATGELTVTAPWLKAPVSVPVDFEVDAQGYAWDAVKDKGIPAHAAPVPGPAVLVRRARLGAGRKLLQAVEGAIGVRADALVDAGSAARKRGDTETAVERYVQALILDPTAPRPAIRGYLTDTRGATLDAVKPPSPLTPPTPEAPTHEAKPGAGKATAAEKRAPGAG